MTPLPLYSGPGDTGELVQQPDAVSFLAARWLHKHRYGYGWWSERRPRVTGISSNAMAAYGAGEGARPTTWYFPADAGDLAACERTYAMAPDDVRARMLPVLVEYREHVVGRGQG